MAGGYTSDYTSSVLTLLPGAEDWTPLASLPQPLYSARASIVRGRLRMTGGYDGGSSRSEVSYHVNSDVDVDMHLHINHHSYGSWNCGSMLILKQLYWRSIWHCYKTTTCWLQILLSSLGAWVSPYSMESMADHWTSPKWESFPCHYLCWISAAALLIIRWKF